MNKPKQFFIRSKEDVTPRFNAAFQSVIEFLQGGNVVLTLSRETRSNLQNAKMWPMLEDLADQVEYIGKKRSREAWKDICTVAWKEETELVMSLDGTKLIAVGLSTSGLSKVEFAEFIEVIYATGAEFGVIWSEKAEIVINEYKIAK